MRQKLPTIVLRVKIRVHLSGKGYISEFYPISGHLRHVHPLYARFRISRNQDLSRETLLTAKVQRVR